MSVLRKVSITVVCLIALLTVAGAAYQWIGSRVDARRAPEAGRLVDIGGYRLNINCTGTGNVTVILESGLGDLAPEWQPVQNRIAKFARVCSYDRAGYASSDAGPMPRTSAVIATELHALLQSANEKPPFILVGHSFGGYNVRVFNGKYPKETAALVLVDSPQEDEYQLLPAAWKKFDEALIRHYTDQANSAPLFVGFGLARLTLRLRGPLRDDDYLILQSKYLRARASELQNMQISAEQARAAGNLGDKPLIVLTAGKSFEAGPLPGLTGADITNMQRMWLEDLQPRLVRLSAHGRQLVLRDSSHDVPSDRPDAVAQAVHDLAAAVHSQP